MSRAVAPAIHTFARLLSTLLCLGASTIPPALSQAQSPSPLGGDIAPSSTLSPTPPASKPPQKNSPSDVVPFANWTSSFALRGGLGYSDNIVLAPTNAPASAFASAGAELFLLRMPVDHRSFFLFFSGDDRRYFDAARIAANSTNQIVATKEQTFTTNARGEIRLGEREQWTPLFSVLHFYNNQVFDASDFDQRGGILAEGHLVQIQPGLRYQPIPKIRLELSWAGTRQIFRSPLSSHWEHGPRALFAWDYTTNSALEGIVSTTFRDYDDRLKADAAGFPVLGAGLESQDLREELLWRHTWIHRAPLSTTARLYAQHRRDNGSGYFDYDRWGASLNLRWRISRFEAQLTGRWERFDYPVQLVSPALPESRVRDDWSTELNLSWQTTDRLRIFSTLSYDRSVSNVPLDSYRVRQCILGAEFEF